MGAAFISNWKPLEKKIGSKCQEFMFMGRLGRINLYKHIFSRRYINLDDSGNCYISRNSRYKRADVEVQMGLIKAKQTMIVRQNLHELAQNCEKEILERQLPEGGWGFGRSKQWVTESTCLALLALRLQPSPVYARGLEFLQCCQNSNGSWPAFAGDDDSDGSWVTALAVTALIRLAGDWKSVERGVSWLLKSRGRESHWPMKWRYRLTDRKVKFDPDKYGWPWTVGASSWVVPTAYSLIALRQAFTCCVPEAVDLRLKKGVEMLIDRGCPGGGWNAGNGIVYDVPLEPHVDITSLALVALVWQGDYPFVRKSLDWLQCQRDVVSSIYSLSWMAMGLAAHRRPVGPIMERLIQRYRERGISLECETLALIRIAVQMADGVNPFIGSYHEWRDKD